MKTSVVTLLSVLCVGAVDYFGYRFAANEVAWRIDKATKLGELAQGEHNFRTAQMFRNYPTEPGTEWATTHLEKDINQLAEDEVIDAKQRLAVALQGPGAGIERGGSGAGRALGTGPGRLERQGGRERPSLMVTPALDDAPRRLTPARFAMLEPDPRMDGRSVRLTEICGQADAPWSKMPHSLPSAASSGGWSRGGGGGIVMGATMPARFWPATFAAGLRAAGCLGGCAVPDQTRARLEQATIPAEYRSPDGQYVVRLRGGMPPTYQLVRVQDGRVLGRAESVIKKRELRTDPPSPTMVNVVFSSDDASVCVEEALSGDTGPAGRYILFRHRLSTVYRDLGYAVGYLQPEANMWTERVHYGEPYEWPQVLGVNQTTIRFYYPRSKQACYVSLDSMAATEKPTTLE